MIPFLKWLLKFKLSKIDSFVDDESLFYVVSVPDDTPAANILRLTEALNDSFDANFIVAPKSITVKEITEEVIRQYNATQEYHGQEFA